MFEVLLEQSFEGKNPSTKMKHRFRWAALQLAELRNLKISRPHYISNALNKMPRTLDATYERALSAIDDEYAVEAQTALQWLAFSIEPLTVAELAEACSIFFDDDNVLRFEEGGYNALVGLFSVLSPFILVESMLKSRGSEELLKDLKKGGKYEITCYRQRVRLAHFSVKEYLVSSKIQQSNHRLSRYALREAEVHRYLSQSCCAYFLHLTTERKVRARKLDGYGESIIIDNWRYFTESHPLIRHVCRHWAQHQSLAEIGMETLVTKASFHVQLLGDHMTRTSWLRLSLFDIHNRNAYIAKQCEGHVGTALYCASFAGLCQTVNFLLRDHVRENVNRIVDGKNAPLQIAAHQGHERVVELLVANGADVGVEGGRFGTALIAAAYGGHNSTVSRLLKANISTRTLNFESIRYGNALQAAAKRGYVCIVEQLLQCNADHGNAIIGAAFNNHEEIVQAFIKLSVDLNARFPKQKVKSSSRHRHILAPKHLIHPDTISVLEVAVLKRSEDMVKKLLHAGANATSFSSPLLELVAYQDESRKLELLIAAGLKIDPSDAELVEKAIEGSSMAMIDVLIRAGFQVTPEMFKTNAGDVRPEWKDYKLNGKTIAEWLATSDENMGQEHEAVAS